MLLLRWTADPERTPFNACLSGSLDISKTMARLCQNCDVAHHRMIP